MKVLLVPDVRLRDLDGSDIVAARFRTQSSVTHDAFRDLVPEMLHGPVAEP